MIGALEKQKFVYVLNRDAQANLTISSPLEAHKSHTIVYHIAGVDVGFGNPTFAAIEVDYESLEEEKEGEHPWKKMLVYYELDLGLNHVTRKWAERADDGAYMLMPVPGGSDGPGGVLVVGENIISYMNQNHETLRAPIPRRYGATDKVLITAVATLVQKNVVIFLVQSEFGDLYRINLITEQDEENEFTVKDITVKYFDTIPVCVSMCLLKTGYLFAASEFGNHYLFQFHSLGDDEVTATTSSKLDPTDLVYFQPRAPVNLLLIDEMDSLAPIVDMKVEDLAGEHTPQIYTLCGRGPRSTLRVLRHGLPVTEVARSDLPGNPTNVWAIKKNASDAYTNFIIVSFVNSTVVLSVSGGSVAEVTDTGILDSSSSLSVSLLGDNSILQVHPNGIRHIRADRRINEWKTPGKKTITQCAVNRRQVVVALTGGELVYFELDKMGQLMDVHRKEAGADVACLAIGPIPEGRQRSHFLVVGFYDNTVRVLSLDHSDPMRQLTVQAVKSQPHSLLLAHLSGEQQLALHLYIGLQDGVLMRSVVDDANGSLIDTRKRFLGTRPVKLFQVEVQGNTAVLAFSSRPWLSYTFQNRLHLTPLSSEPLESASSFASEQCPEGFVCITESSLRVVALERLGQLFHQNVFPLRYTPRKAVVHPSTKHLVILETDQNTYPESIRKEIMEGLKVALADAERAANEDAMITDEDGQVKKEPGLKAEGEEEKKEDPSEVFVGVPAAGLGKWASCIRIFDAAKGETLSLLELEGNEAAFSACLVNFGSPEMFLAVGTAKDLNLKPKSVGGGFIRLYRFSEGGASLELVHKTPVHDVPLAMAPFQKRLLVGVGKYLRIYELGKRKLLRKTENKNFPVAIANINVMGDRIFVGDVCESFFYCAYKQSDNTLAIFADSLEPRHLTAAAVLDYDTVAGADKFGNIHISRLPSDVSAKIQKDPTGGHVFSVYGEESKKKVEHKLDVVSNYHVGETVAALCKTALVPGGTQVLLYATVMGGIGMLQPFTSREDVDFYSHLEMHMRNEASPLCGRDHLAFRSYYFPVKDCVDGDLCEMYSLLEPDRQRAIADELVASPAEVAKKLEEIRNRVL